MRFSKGFRVTAYEPTSRKRAAVVRRQRLEREKLPLFADEIGEGQADPDQVLADRAVHWVERQQAQRDQIAARWREARARLASLPEPGRSALLAYWNAHRWLPGDPSYLAGEVRRFERGDLILHEGKVVPADQLRWERQRDAKIAALSDAELDAMIQTHISPMFVDLARAERRRRAEAAAAEAPAPRPHHRIGRR